MTVEAVLMLTPCCPPPSLSRQGCLVWATACFDITLCSVLCVLSFSFIFFSFFPLLSFQPVTKTAGQKLKYCFGEIRLADWAQTCVSAYVRVLGGCGVNPWSQGERETSSSMFQTTSCYCSCRMDACTLYYSVSEKYSFFFFCFTNTVLIFKNFIS